MNGMHALSQIFAYLLITALVTLGWYVVGVYKGRLISKDNGRYFLNLHDLDAEQRIDFRVAIDRQRLVATYMARGFIHGLLWPLTPVWLAIWGARLLAQRTHKRFTNYVWSNKP